MTDVVERTRTEFQAVGVGAYQRSMMNVGGAANRAGQMVRATTGLLRPFNMMLGLVGLGGGVMALRSVGRINEAVDDMQKKLGGTISAFGMVKDYAQGFDVAGKLIGQVAKQTAALPESTGAYVESLKMMLPNVKKALGGSVIEATTAATKMMGQFSALGMGAGEAGFMIMRALGPQGMLMTRGLGGMRILALLQSVKGHANLTAKAFNEMTQPQRAVLLQQALSEMAPVVKSLRDDFSGTTATIHKTLGKMVRLSTVPLFEVMERQMVHVRDLLVDVNGELTPFARQIVAGGQVIAKFVGRQLERVVLLLSYVSGHWETITKQTKRYGAVLASLYLVSKSRPLLGAFGVAGRVAGAAAAPVAGAVAGAAVGGGVAGASGLQALVAGLQALSKIFLPLALVVGVVAGAVALVSEQWRSFSQIFGVVGTLVAAFAGDIFQAVMAVFGTLSTVFKALAGGLGVFLIPMLIVAAAVLRPFAAGLKLVFGALQFVIDLIYQKLKPSFDFVYDMFARVAKYLGQFSSDTAKVIEGWSKSMEAAGVSKGAPGLPAAAYQDYGPPAPTTEDLLKKLEKSFGMPPPGAPGGPKVVQDFRNSRFSISQAFAEGFDPDRVGVAFSKQVGRIGEQRLQSGFEPMFAVR